MANEKRPRRRSPSDEKRVSLKRDHVQVVEYPKGFRKLWPRKKVQTKRAHRHAVRQILDALTPEESEAAVNSLRRKLARKWPGTAVPLGEAIVERERGRARRDGRRKQPRGPNSP
jgi:hypothetical protein